MNNESEGTPQGGVISPLLANIALHGMENEINKLAETFNMKEKRGRQMSKSGKIKSVNFIRYADDFVILHEDIEKILLCKEHLSNMILLKHYETEIKRHIKVKGNASPYDGNLIYWSSRMGKHPEMPKTRATLLKRQNGKCAHCNLFFREGDVIELDHITPKSKGGKNEYKNLQLLHRHCHDEKTLTDGSLERSGNKTDLPSVMPKPLWNIPNNYLWIDDMLVTTY